MASPSPMKTTRFLLKSRPLCSVCRSMSAVFMKIWSNSRSGLGRLFTTSEIAFRHFLRSMESIAHLRPVGGFRRTSELGEGLGGGETDDNAQGFAARAGHTNV